MMRTARSRRAEPVRGRKVTIALLAVAAVLFVYPIVMLAVGAFRNTDPSLPAAWSFDGFHSAYADGETYRTLRDSLLLALVCATLSTALALYLAFVVARTRAPLRRLVTPMMAVSLAMPPLFFALSWGMLGNAEVGLINKALGWVVGGDVSLVDVNSWAGLVLVISLKMTSFAYLLLLGPFRALDRGLEEAAQVSGSGRLRTFLTVDVPVLAPAITGVFILGFVVGLESFDVPLLLGLPAGINVISTRIYGMINDQTPADYGGASAISLLLVVVVILLVTVQWRVLGRRRFTTVTGKGYRTAPWDIGRWRLAGTAVIVGYLLLAVLLPVVQLVLGALQPYFGAYGRYSFDNISFVINDPILSEAIRATLLISATSGLAAALLAAVISYQVARSTSRLRRLLDLATWLPWAVPGVVLSLAMAWAYISVPGLSGLYGTVWLVGIGLVVAAVPVASRATQGAIAQLGVELEESARTSGAGPTRTFFGIVLRLIAPSFAAAWFVAAITISGNLAVPSLLSSLRNQTVPIQVFRLYSKGETAQAGALLLVMMAVLFAGLGVLWLVIRLLGRVVDARVRAADRTAKAPPDDAAPPPPAPAPAATASASAPSAAAAERSAS
ncbi:ABC transporter permease [Streptomyces profundus]|uniref:ABC transporter permease n=1 Tax=Streptomyces profundus TaxID=2867410 RepID=UPI001D169691|nr:iron ABC transporter permease [Streptomyces sp. MA3_2.13]UED83252.1 iron ABC transporter permease [Streptomyces sp. MA3_2.13]